MSTNLQFLPFEVRHSAWRFGEDQMQTSLLVSASQGDVSESQIKTSVNLPRILWGKKSKNIPERREWSEIHRSQLAGRLRIDQLYRNACGKKPQINNAFCTKRELLYLESKGWPSFVTTKE